LSLSPEGSTRVKYKLVAFDFDGTLADSFDCFLSALNQTAATLKFRPLAVHELAEVRGLSSQQLMRHLGIRPWQVPLIGVLMRRRMQAEIERVQLFAGMETALTALEAAGIALGIVTSNSLKNISHVLGPENLRRFQYLECSVGLFGKARRLRRLRNVSGLPPSAVLLVGDEIRDAQAAQAAGWDFLGVSWGYASPAVLQPHSAGPLLAHPAELRSRLVDGPPS